MKNWTCFFSLGYVHKFCLIIIFAIIIIIIIIIILVDHFAHHYFTIQARTIQQDKKVSWLILLPEFMGWKYKVTLETSDIITALLQPSSAVMFLIYISIWNRSIQVS